MVVDADGVETVPGVVATVGAGIVPGDVVVGVLVVEVAGAVLPSIVVVGVACVSLSDEPQLTITTEVAIAVKNFIYLMIIGLDF